MFAHTWQQMGFLIRKKPCKNPSPFQKYSFLCLLPPNVTLRHHWLSKMLVKRSYQNALQNFSLNKKWFHLVKKVLKVNTKHKENFTVCCMILQFAVASKMQQARFAAPSKMFLLAPLNFFSESVSNVLVIAVFCPVLIYLPKSAAQAAEKFSPEQKKLLNAFQLITHMHSRSMNKLKNTLNNNQWVSPPTTNNFLF